jgi:hypothetical protein
MGEIADMMLDGTMDFETGEFNFDGEDGPGFPMTGAQAAAWNRDYGRRHIATIDEPAFKVKKADRRKIEAHGELMNHSAYHWQVRKDGKVVADWWPHKNKWRIGGRNSTGNVGAFIKALGQ